MVNEQIRVMVVDDTAIYRKIVSDVLSEMPEIEVVGRAPNGQVALEKLDRLKPHLVTLDVEMPVMDGLEVLRRLKQLQSNVGVIMLSARTAYSAQATVTALKLGALDFVLKPSGRSIDENMNELRESLGSRVLGLGRTQRVRNIVSPARSARRAVPAVAPKRSVRTPQGPKPPPKVITVGISTGGPQALQRFLPHLPGDLRVPMVIVQHMPPVFTKSLADDLNKRCALTICEGAEGQQVLPGHVYIAPGGKQMRLIKKAGGLEVEITNDPPENSCRPSVDYLFRSVYEHYGANTLAVIMTGMGNDGTAGCRQISRGGGTIFAQDETSCVVFGMPRQPIEEGLAEFVGTPERLAAEIAQLVNRRELACQ